MPKLSPPASPNHSCKRSRTPHAPLPRRLLSGIWLLRRHRPAFMRLPADELAELIVESRRLVFASLTKAKRAEIEG